MNWSKAKTIILKSKETQNELKKNEAAYKIAVRGSIGYLRRRENLLDLINNPVSYRGTYGPGKSRKIRGLSGLKSASGVFCHSLAGFVQNLSNLWFAVIEQLYYTLPRVSGFLGPYPL